MTRVLPNPTRTEPEAFGATLGRKEMGRSWSFWRPSGRCMAEVNREWRTVNSEFFKVLNLGSWA